MPEHDHPAERRAGLSGEEEARLLSAEEMELIRAYALHMPSNEQCQQIWELIQSDGRGIPEMLLNHVDAQAERIAALEAEREELRELLRETRAYTARLEGKYMPMMMTHSYMPRLPGTKDEIASLSARLDAALGQKNGKPLPGPSEAEGER